MRLLTNRAVVVAMYEQRPDQDETVVQATEKHLEAYRQRLARQTPELGQGAVDRDRLFVPQTAILWGQHDHALFYLADDLESVHSLSFTSGARSEEFLVGTPYQQDTDPQTLFFDPENASRRPAIALCRIKLGDHLLAAHGAGFVLATAKAIRSVCGVDVTPLIMRCWSWPEILVVLQSGEPAELFEAVARIEGLTVAQLWDDEPFKARFDEPFTARPDGQLLKRWVGSGFDDERAKTRLKDCNVIVSVRSQFGMLEAGWDTAAKPFSGSLRNSVRKAFGGGRSDGTQFTEGQIADLAQAFQTVRASAPLAKQLSARISAQPKPGHLAFVDEYVRKLTDALTDSTATIAAAEQTEGAIRISIPATLEGLGCLLATSHSFRLHLEVRRHLDSTTTMIEWPSRPTAPATSLSPIDGYKILTVSVTPEALSRSREVAHQRGLGRVQANAFMSWYRSVVNMAHRPDMFGSLAYLHAGTLAAYRQMETAPHGADEAVRAACDLVSEYGLQSYQQRIQFSSALQSAPPINGQVPSGINQIIAMVDGVWATIAQSAFLTSRDDDNLEAEGRDSIVLFGSHTGVCTRAALHITFLHLSLVQAMTPLSLSLLFHELGHLMVRRKYWEESQYDDNALDGFATRLSEWASAVHCLSKDVTEWLVLPDEPMSATWSTERTIWISRLDDFLEDVFAHAVWRRVGCGNDLEVFETQFLAGHAMGLQTGATETRAQRRVAADVWAETVAHLAIQRALHQSQDEIRSALALLSRNPKHYFDSALKTTWAYCACEIARELIATNDGLTPDNSDYWQTKFGTIANRYWLTLMAGIAYSGRHPKHRAYRTGLQALLTRMSAVAEQIDEAEELSKFRGASPEEVFSRIELGTFDLASDAWLLEGGCPSPSAIVMVRTILRAITRDFASARAGDEVVCLPRKADMSINFEEGERRGVYADMAGGTWVAGKTERPKYLRARVAAIQGLAHISHRVSAGLIAAQLPGIDHSSDR